MKIDRLLLYLIHPGCLQGTFGLYGIRLSFSGNKKSRVDISPPRLSNWYLLSSDSCKQLRWSKCHHSAL